MAITLSRAKPLCTKTEWQLLTASTLKGIKRLGQAQLKAKISRCRRLRDKYRDLAQKQRREALGRGKPGRKKRVPANQNTIRKQEFFADALKRFQSRLADLQSARPSAKPFKASASRSGKSAKASPAARSRRATSRKPLKDDGASDVAIRAASLLAGLLDSARNNVSMLMHAERARPNRIKRRKQSANIAKIQGHVSSRGRRAQGRRDSK